MNNNNNNNVPSELDPKTPYEVDLFRPKSGVGRNDALVFFQPDGTYRALLADGGHVDAPSLVEVANGLLDAFRGRQFATVELRFPQGGRQAWSLVDWCCSLGDLPNAGPLDR